MYQPCENSELYIRYRYRGKIHEAILEDEEPMLLPQEGENMTTVFVL